MRCKSMVVEVIKASRASSCRGLGRGSQRRFYLNKLNYLFLRFLYFSVEWIHNFEKKGFSLKFVFSTGKIGIRNRTPTKLCYISRTTEQSIQRPKHLK